MNEFETRHFTVTLQQDDSFTCSFNEDSEFEVDFGANVAGEYQGAYEVEPTGEYQSLHTTNKMLTHAGVLTQGTNSGGGASNFITGTFQYSTTTAAAQTITLNYSGSGYPIAVTIVLDDGVLDSTYTNTVARYSIAQYFMTKTHADTAPTFATSGDANQGAVATVYKSSASTASTLTRTSSATANTFSSSAASASTTTCVRFTSKTKMSIYSGANSGTSRYGFFSGKKYRYWVIYSA